MIRSNVAKTVDDFLNEVNYEELNKYIPSTFSIQYLNFLKVISAGQQMDSSPPVHYKMIDGLCDKRQYLANLCSRGLSKSTLFAQVLFLYLAVYQHIPNFGKVDTALYVADSMENGAKTLRKGLESRYEKSAILKKMLPQAKFTDSYIEFTNVSGNKFGLRLYGSKSGIRGTQIFGNRPLLCVIDDIVSDEDASSPTTLAKIEDTILYGVIPALDPNRRKVIWLGTPFNKSDPLYKAVESGEWYVNCYPVCEKFPCEPEEFRGAWESRFGYEAISKQYNMYKGMGKIKAFKQEMMLRIASEEDRIIQDSDIRWFNTFDILKDKQQYNFYITSDFATSTSRKADYTVLGVWAVDKDQNRFLVDGKIDRQTMDITFNDLFSLVQKYNPISVGIEVTGQQGGFVSLLREEANRLGVVLNIAIGKGTNKEGIAVKQNKMERFRLTVPKFKTGKIFLPQDLKTSMLITELLDELSMATIDGIKSVHDDAIDMVSQLDQMYIIYPDEYQSKLKHSSESQVNSVFFTDSGNETDQTGYNSYLA